MDLKNIEKGTRSSSDQSESDSRRWCGGETGESQNAGCQCVPTLPASARGIDTREAMAGARTGAEVEMWSDADRVWVEPTVALPGDGPVLTPEQVKEWQDDGALVCHGVWPESLIEECRSYLSATKPQPPPEAHDWSIEQLESWDSSGAPGGAGGFPFDRDTNHCFNEVTLHPRLLRAASQLLGTDDLRLTQSGLGDKLGTGEPAPVGTEAFGRSHGNQPFHQDYGNNYLTVPPPTAGSGSGPNEAIACILYYTDVEVSNGPTAFVPGLVSDTDLPGIVARKFSGPGLQEPFNRKHQPEGWPDVYAHEKFPRYRAGTAIFYRLDTWHRGTPCRPGGRRWVHHLVWRRADAPWIQFHHEGFARTCALRPWLIPCLSPYQRTLLGFPAIDSPYWTDETVNAVAERYGSALDVAPYREAVATRHERVGERKETLLQTLSFRLTEQEGYDPAAAGADARWHYEDTVRWTLPEPALLLDGSVGTSDSWGRPAADVLTPTQTSQWREEGFLLLDGLISSGLLAEAVAQAAEAYPPAATSAELLAAGAPKNHWSYPFDGKLMTAFNDLPLAPGLMKACAECIGHDDLRLIKAGLNLKTSDFAVRGGVMQGPQLLEAQQTDREDALAAGEELHWQEYGQSTLAVPPLGAQEAVAAVIFLSDVSEAGGALCVVPHTGGADGWGRSVVAQEGSEDNESSLPLGRSKADDPALYAQERATHYKAGTVLLYRLDTFRRETPVKPGGRQLTLSVILKRGDAEHVQWDSWATPMSGTPREYIAGMSVWQRNALPIAAPGDKYWTDDTLMAVAERYKGMDMQPYIDAAAAAAAAGGGGGGGGVLSAKL